jgi:NTP pyrophosphatase (non-canonical NTP hydrolase)
MSQERYLPMTMPNKLAHLAEEAGEVIAAVGKTLRFGLDSENLDLPEEVREKNRDWLKRELEDLKKAIAKVEEFL